MQMTQVASQERCRHFHTTKVAIYGSQDEVILTQYLTIQIKVCINILSKGSMENTMTQTFADSLAAIKQTESDQLIENLARIFQDIGTMTSVEVCAAKHTLDLAGKIGEFDQNGQKIFEALQQSLRERAKVIYRSEYAIHQNWHHEILTRLRSAYGMRFHRNRT